MDENTFQKKMASLFDHIREMPGNDGRSPEAPAAGGSGDELRVSVEELQESLDYLRLSVKYLVFDLEATRRENAYLRRMLEQSSRDAQRDLRDDEEFGGEDFGDND